MRNLNKWFCEKFLPTWCREEMIDENNRLTRRVIELKSENAALKSYIEGMETALRLSKRIKIFTEGVKANGTMERTHE